VAGECKPCNASRAKKGYRYYSTEQQREIAEARDRGEDVNVTVARRKVIVTKKSTSSNTTTTKS
jgi:hypothetical protein